MTSPASPAQPISDELAQIRERDVGPSHGTCWEAHVDRRTLLAAYDQQSAEIARLAKDAARYRWLRDHWDEPDVQKLHPWDEFSPDPDQLDEQIDAALRDQVPG